MKEKKEFWELSFKYEELCRNISEHREFLKNFIDRKKFDRNIQKIAEFIFEEVWFYRNGITYICWKNKFYIDISESQEKENFFKFFCDYKIFWRYNDFLDTYHWNFSQLKYAIENFNRFRLKSKNKRSYKIMEDIASYYIDFFFHKKWEEIKYKEKRKWKKSRKQTFAFKFSSSWTNWTTDWYRTINSKWYVIISALDENHARRVIEDWIIQEMTKCHKLDSFFLQKAELNNDFIEKFRKQENLYRYKPYLIFMK